MRAARLLVGVADELNVYADGLVVDAARAEIAASGSRASLSIFLGWQDEQWPADPRRELRRWADIGIDRMYVSVGGPDPVDRIRQLADARGSLEG
jgi:L-alanine-DL-glutamate epimerase-like enolase superfamily enzyme